jgi:tetratricopeptide (TPR) repeat protein
VNNIQELVEKGKYSQALVFINKELTQDAYNIDLLTIKALVNYKLESYSEAIDIYTGLINLIPNNVENYANRGLAYNAIGDHASSLADLTSAIGFEPDNGYRYSCRAFIKDNLGDHLGALDDYNKAVDLDPDDKVSLNNRGLIEEKLGRTHLAQESIASADKLAGINNQTYNPHVHPVEIANDKQNSFSFKYVLGVINGLLSSADERNKFFNFFLFSALFLH